MLLGQLAPGMADDGGMDDEELLQRVRQLQGQGRLAQKEILLSSNSSAAVS